jgi:hypothetical protein
MSRSTWTGTDGSDWNDPNNWSPTGMPDASSDVVITTGAPVASAPIGAVNSITDSSDLSFESAGINTVTTFLDNTSHLYVDHNRGEGGTTLNVGGTLTNSFDLVIGNTALSASDEVTAAALDNAGKIQLTGAGANQALLDVTGSAGFGTAGVLSGYVRLVGDSAIEFGSGDITRLAARQHLGLVGNDAFIEDSSALGSNSALTGLASIGKRALFALHDGAAVSTTGALANDGQVVLDTGGGDGGSSLTVAGTLTNSHYLGVGNSTLSASDQVTAAALHNTRKIQLTGSGANQALLDVAGSAGFGTAGVLSGNVQLAGDSAIKFASGQISTIAAGATLALSGNDAFIEDSSALGSNSALAGLADIAGSLKLSDGASLSTGPLTNTGSIDLSQALLDASGGAGFGTAGVLTGVVSLAGDSAIEFAGGQITSLNGSLYLNGDNALIEDSTALDSNSALTGLASIGAGAYFALYNGASVTTTGALANDGVLDLFDGSSLTAASLDNKGYVALGGSGASLLDVTGVAGFGPGGVLSGHVELGGDSAIEFTSGEITSLAAGADLQLNGNDTFIEDSTALGSNSALTGLASISGGATLDLEEGGASLSTTGALVNDGNILLRDSTFPNGGGSTLSIGGALTNNGTLGIVAFKSSEQVTAKSFVNTGTVNLSGGSSSFAALNVSGALTNNGSISITYDTEAIAGAVGGAGSFSLSKANLRFDSSVSAGQTINESGVDHLTLKHAQNFHGTVSGFGTGDTIDAANFLWSGTTFNFTPNFGGTGGTLTLHDGSLTANISMTGVYTKSDFTLAPDHGTGTLVKFV